jgi:Xaa-Pro aminopeptidase
MNRNKRILKLMSRMKEEGIETFLIKNSNNVFYFSGVKSSNAWVLIYKEEAWFLTDFRYLEVAEKELKD